MPSSPPDRLHIFISYSHRDAKYLERLKVHLTPYVEDDAIEDWLWDDTQIAPGSNWFDDITQALQRADAAVLLISADFLASRFIRQNELPPLLDAAEQKGIKVIPVILSPCGFENVPSLSQFQSANKPSEPLSSLHTFHKREEWWEHVAEKIYTVTTQPYKGKADVAISIEVPEKILANIPPNLFVQSPVDTHERATPLASHTHAEKYPTEEKQDTSPERQLELKDIQQITQFIGHEDGVTALALSPDNQTLVSGDQRGKVKVWDIAKKTSFAPKNVPMIGTLAPFHPLTLNSVTSIVFHPEGRTFLAGWRSGTIHLWQCQTGELLESFQVPSPSALFRPGKGVISLAVSPDGLGIIGAGVALAGRETIYTAHNVYAGRSPEDSLHLYRYPKTDQPFHTKNYDYVYRFGIAGSWEETPSIAFSTKGHFFAASSSTEIRIWNIAQSEEGLPLRNKTNTRDFFTSITFHPNENLLAAINAEGQCLIWDLSTGNILNVLDPLSGKITAIAFSPGGSHLAAAHSSGTLGFWSPFSGEWIKPFKAHEQAIPALVYSSDGCHLVSASLDKTIKMWEITEIKRFSPT